MADKQKKPKKPIRRKGPPISGKRMRPPPRPRRRMKLQAAGKQGKGQKQVQRRKYSRVKTSVKVRIQKYNAEDKTFSTDAGTSKNVSAGGLLIHHHEPLKLGRYVMVSFSLPGSDEELDFVAKVVRVEELIDKGYDIGVMFMRKAPGEYEKLHMYVFDAL